MGLIYIKATRWPSCMSGWGVSRMGRKGRRRDTGKPDMSSSHPVKRSVGILKG